MPAALKLLFLSEHCNQRISIDKQLCASSNLILFIFCNNKKNLFSDSIIVSRIDLGIMNDQSCELKDISKVVPVGNQSALSSMYARMFILLMPMFDWYCWTHSFLFFHLGLNVGVNRNSSNCNYSSNTSLCGNLVTCIYPSKLSFGHDIYLRGSSKAKFVLINYQRPRL